MAEPTEDNIIHRELDTDAENPAVEIAELVADVEGTDTTELPAMYDIADHVLDHLFSTPPAPEAQFKVSFSYEGYRITVEQNGAAELIDTET
ncbi:HalOD1 output domain-containing protein [Halobacterium sp. R2-5]|uniref:HalOD1 output domain-containing protein n=1 Tax=Halobacterium sp. R2-5 TaxID=2715751 RepID=UPI001421EFD9|nr:HalOD1 output domain-containing protein [Halobacterium sp. R2-5]NIB99289.1 hypothetical protein [Halobacterium sp. R2-5]